MSYHFSTSFFTERDRSADIVRSIFRQRVSARNSNFRPLPALIAKFVLTLLNLSLLVRGLSNVPELCGAGGAMARRSEVGGEAKRGGDARIGCGPRGAKHI